MRRRPGVGGARLDAKPGERGAEGAKWRVSGANRQCDRYKRAVWLGPRLSVLCCLTASLLRCAPPSHYHINDATGASLVLQFDAAGRLRPLDNPLGVLTNGPNLAEQYKHHKWWTGMVARPPYSEVPVVHGGPFVAVAGSFNQTDRFTRLAQLRKYAGQVAWAEHIPGLDDLTPAYAPPGAPASNPQLMVAVDMMQSVWLPRGLDDSSASGAKSDWTVWGVVRDHALRGYYYRVANAPVYRAVHLARVNWSALAGRVRYSQMKTGGWAVDGTQDWAAAPMHDGPPANVPRGFFPLDV